MEVCVLSRDLMFFTAVEGLALPMGIRVRQAESLSDIGTPDILVADFASLRIDLTTLVAAFDPLRTAVFVPHVQVDVFTAARASGISHVYRRGALATELPRVLSEYSA